MTAAKLRLSQELEDLSEYQLQLVEGFIAFLKTPPEHPTMTADLQAQLREGAIRRAERDSNLAEEWFVLESNSN